MNEIELLGRVLGSLQTQTIDRNTHELAHPTGGDGGGRLMMALQKDYTEISELLLGAGVDVNDRDSHSMNALHWAIQRILQGMVCGSEETVRVLLIGNIDLNAGDKKESTSLSHDLSRGPILLRPLIAGGADIGLLSKSDRNILREEHGIC